jgi:cyclophilin family peptidyl-prolyl cis-trans isomerase
MSWKTAWCFLAALLPFSSVHAGTFVQFRTSLGDIAVELYDTDKPVTVTNFLHYVKKGYTNDMIIHRVAGGAFIQGGLFYIKNRQTAPSFATIPLNPAIVNEYATGRIFSNTYGTLAMSKEVGQANSATSQWFFNLANNPVYDTIDGGYTVFGRVIGGFDVLNSFLTSPPIWSYNGTAIDSRLANLPVRVPTAPPGYNDLVYIDITLLDIRITHSEAGKVIQWRSAKNVINTVQYTTTFPPVWQTLASPFGNGNDMAVTDTSGDPKRFYRIRVAY